MPINISNFELAEITGGQLGSAGGEKFIATGVEFDSRRVSGGELFIALAGEKVHGHDFVQKAYDQGASLFLVESLKPFADFPDPGRLIEVGNSLQGFTELAAWWRKGVSVPIMAVTGSVGKTTVKEFLASILLATGRGYYSYSSYNGLIGVPYSICQINPEHEWIVLEMGMSAPGELEKLSQLVKPEIAIITQIAPSHIGFFGSLEKITDAKCEIVSGMKEGSVVILNRDDKVLMSAAERHQFDKKFDLKYFGTSKESDLRIVEVESYGVQGLRISLTGTRELELTVPIIGKHNATNIAAAILGAHYSGRNLDDQAIISSLTKVNTPKSRMEVRELADERFIVDDSYNASPTSMGGIIDFALELKQAGRKVGLVFGDMLELGEKSLDFHERLIKKVENLRPEFLIVVGRDMVKASDNLDGTGIRVLKAENAQVAGNLASRLSFDVLIVKASRSIGLDQVLQSFEDKR